jgi:hypothetical protein
MNFSEARTLDDVMKQWAMSHYPTVKLDLSRRNNKWQVELNEHWPDNLNPAAEWTPIIGGDILGERVEWSEKTLDTWDSCKRMAYNQWWFDSKNDAEKFITFYTLTWAE